MEESVQGKHFSITELKNVNTVIYQIYRTAKEFCKTSPKFTIQRLEYTEELVGDNKKKTFFVDEISTENNHLVILSFGQEKVVVNMGILEEDIVKISKKPMPMKFKTLFSSEETEYKDFTYTPNLKRPIAILDPETTEEIKPVLYYDESAKEVKGKCKLKPNKSYFAFEIREESSEEDWKGIRAWAKDSQMM